jgi:hypothetical protein
MYTVLQFVLIILVSLTCSQATEREYVISNISRLLNSYSIADYTKCTDEAIDPKKYDCALRVNEFNRQQSKTLTDLFDQFTQEKMDEDKLLKCVLDIRFHNLNFFQRHEGFKFDMKYNPFPNIQMGPGSSLLCRKLETGNGFNLLGEDYAKYIVGAERGGLLLRFIPIIEQNTYEKFGDIIANYEKITDREVKDAFAPLINDNLYVLTQIILGIFSLRPLHDFSYDTLDYISASRSLWPLLEKVAQGADPFLLDDDASLFDNKALINEYEIYATCLLKTSTVKMPFMGLGCIPNRDYMRTLGTLMESGALLGKWSLPELPTTLDKMRIPQATATISPSAADITVEAISAKNGMPHKKPKNRSVQNQKPMSSSDVQPTTVGITPLVGTSALSESIRISEDVQPQILREKPLTLPDSSAEASAALSTTEQKPAAVDSVSIDESNDEPIYDYTSYNKTTSKTKGRYKNQRKETTSAPEPQAPQMVEHIFAPWNRKLHAQRNLTDIPLRTEPVSPTQLKVVRDVFDPSTKITYGVFEALWTHLNGKNSIKPSHKRSHRRLLNSQGKVVGGTFALHGSKHQYSDDNKRELQDALTLIGCGRSYLASRENQ